MTEADHPWLRALLDERERFVGRKRGEWKVRLGEPLSVETPRHKLDLALRVLDRLSPDHVQGGTAPRQIRAVLFRAAAQEPERSHALARAATLLELSPEALLDRLFADLPDERVLVPLAEPQTPQQLALACNAELIASLLAAALRVRIHARGHVRAVVRHAKLMGLLCHTSPGDSKDEVALDISGPYALFRHTRVYARALASLVPRLSWCSSYRLEADCVLSRGASVRRLHLHSGDPIAPARELAPFDSKVEERFARSFAKLAPEWDVIREPRPVEAGDALMFPDFELCHRATGERWLLEIVGYWTAEYVRRKLQQLRDAQLERLIVCIDEERCCGDEPLEIAANVVRYRRKVDPRAVLAIVDPAALAAEPALRSSSRASRSQRPRSSGSAQ